MARLLSCNVRMQTEMLKVYFHIPKAINCKAKAFCHATVTRLGEGDTCEYCSIYFRKKKNPHKIMAIMVKYFTLSLNHLLSN